MDTSLALAWVVILPNDVANPAAEGLAEFRDLLIMQQVQVMDVLTRVICLNLFSFIYKYLMLFTLFPRVSIELLSF